MPNIGYEHPWVRAPVIIGLCIKSVPGVWDSIGNKPVINQLLSSASKVFACTLAENKRGFGALLPFFPTYESVLRFFSL